MKFDTSQKGLNTFFYPYQSAILEHIWDLNGECRTGITSGQAYRFLQKTGNEELHKSRSSIITFLNTMVEEGVLSYEEESGKGGYHKVYFPVMNRDRYAKHAITMIIRKLVEVFPSGQI